MLNFFFGSGIRSGMQAKTEKSYFLRNILKSFLLDGACKLLISLYGLQCPGGIFLQKVVIFFLSLRAHHGQVFYPSNKSFAFLCLSWLGHPKNVRYVTHFSYGGSGGLGGPTNTVILPKEPP